MEPMPMWQRMCIYIKWLSTMMAEREGFEPSIRFCRILTFQASAFDHSATAPLFAQEGAHLSGDLRTGKVAGRNGRP